MIRPIAKSLTTGLMLGASALLLACSEPATDGAPGTMSAVTNTSLSITEPFINPPLAGRDVAAGYFSGLSVGQDDRLISASADFADATEVHTHLMEDGVMKMREVEAVEFPDGEPVTFERGGYHLMMFGANIPDGARELPITLTFEKAGEHVVPFIVGD